MRAELPSNRAFASYDQAMANILGPPLPDDTNLFWEQGVLDVLFEYPITSDRSQFAIHPGFTRLGLQVNVGLRFLSPTAPERVFDVHADVGIVELDPRWHQAAWLFIKEGFWHILDGTDHLLFLLCLVIPFRRMRALLVVVTAFTVAHSITLIASAYNVAPDALWFPPLVETLIAASIFYMAIENIVGAQHRTPLGDDLRVRPGARLRLLVPAARAPAVRGLAPAVVAAGVQRRRGVRSAAGADGADPRPRLPVHEGRRRSGWA